jgi:enamine deaminase RidA (YjgF/YER057c/UK114 family)
VTIYLPDLADLPVLNELWDAYIPDGHAPARACIKADLVNKDYKCEMVVTAATL